MGTSKSFPKKVPRKYLSGSFRISFAMFPAVRSQCSQSVKLKMNQNNGTEMFPSGTFRMSLKFRSW